MTDKHKVIFAVNDQYAELEMCMFCKRLPDICAPELCVHYEADYQGISCPGFEKVENVEESLLAALAARAKESRQ